MSTQPQQLPLVPEETEWFTGEPPFLGWYNTKLADHPGPAQPIRRFYKGCGKWSRPATFARALEGTSPFGTESLAYQGLTGPAPEGYDYDVVDSQTGEIVQIAKRPEPSRRRLKISG